MDAGAASPSRRRPSDFVHKKVRIRQSSGRNERCDRSRCGGGRGENGEVAVTEDKNGWRLGIGGWAHCGADQANKELTIVRGDGDRSVA